MPGMGNDDLRSTDRHIVKAACPHDCPDTCAMEITVENGVAVEVSGAAMPFTAGTLCTKVAKYLDRTYSKDRVLYPLRRVGAKGRGQGRLERISWDAALDEITARFKSIAAEDPQQILPCSYAGTMGLLQYMWDHGYTRAEPTREAEDRWTAHVVKMYEIMLMRKAKSWFTGYNSNLAGHEEDVRGYLESILEMLDARGGG